MFEFGSDSSQNTRVTLLAQLLQPIRIIHLIARCISPLFGQCYVEEISFETYILASALITCTRAQNKQKVSNK